MSLPATSQRAHVEAAEALVADLMALFGEEKPDKAARSAGGTRGLMPQWQQHIEAIAKLPRSRQQFVAEMLKNVLSQGAAQ